MNFVSLIEAKRSGAELASEDWPRLVQAYVAGRIPDYQMAAFLMAVFFRGLSLAETRDLTLAMRDSGEVLAWPKDPRPVVDKHSTGGVGDKVSLPLAPLLACLGFRVPMISGRGLGITGGTLDKLGSIPGFTTALDPARLVEQVQSIGVALAGQTATMVPADQKLYALRDVTGTVPSIPLIAASILSKKLAESPVALVLDVKFGTAAFMKTLSEARNLASAMIRLGGECGLKIKALLTSMSTPLGRAAGNWLEVKESVDCLNGRGPEDLQELVVHCAAHLLVMTQQATHWQEAEQRALNCLASGEPGQRWKTLLLAQATDMEAYENLLSRDSLAPVVRDLPSPGSGVVTRCEARVIGEVVRDLGAGRLTKESHVHPEVGIDRLIKPGEPVNAGAALCRVHALDMPSATAALDRLRKAFEIEETYQGTTSLIKEIIE